jgi:hypothetical protein
MENRDDTLQTQQLKESEGLKKTFRSIESFYAASFARLKVLEEKLVEMKKEWESFSKPLNVGSKIEE